MKVIITPQQSLNNLLPKQQTYLSKFKFTWILLLILSTLTWQCKKEEAPVGLSGICPVVVSTDPANGATNVVTNKIISVTFNEPMNAATITAASFMLKDGSNAVGGTISYSGNTAVFTPASDLKANTVYTGIITTAVKDVAKNSLIADYVWSFNTGNTPIVVSTDPTNGTTNVQLNKIVTATFSTAMNPTTITSSSFMLKNGTTAVAGAVSYVGMVATFTPTTALLPNTVYTGTITNTVKDVAGNTMTNNYVWSFATGTGVAPTVISTDPANNATNVALTKIIKANFSTAMDASTVTGTSFTITQGVTPVVGIVTYAGTTATFTPSAALQNNRVYTATITTVVKDALGNAMANNYTWSFTTTTANPTVISTDPANNANSVAVNKTITATFSTPMDATTINVLSYILTQGGNQVFGTVTYTGSTASFNPSSNLINGTLYTASITTAAKDVAGNSLTNNYTWTFTTVGAAPTITSTDPTSNATNVVFNKIIRATFSTVMDPSTIDGTSFLLTRNGNPVVGNVTYTGTTASFTPAASLISNTVYTATITTAAKNMAGISMVSNYVWTFTTLTTVLPPAPPLLGDAAPFGAFGGSAGVTNQGIFTIINGSLGTTAVPTAVTGFHDILAGQVYTETPLNIGGVTNRIYTATPFPGTVTSFNIATATLLDATNAFNNFSPALMPGGIDPGAGELGGLTLPPGIYKSASGTFNISNGNLVLDAQGNANATWVFQCASGLTVGISGPAGARSVTLINGGLAKNVYWQVGSAATINGAGGGIMTGTILAYGGVTFSTAGNVIQTVLNGRALSLNASVTMVNTTINVPN
jgi:hypothetical protein